MPDTTAEADTAVPTELESSSSSAEPLPETPLVESDLLVEDVSIDGMCGVY